MIPTMALGIPGSGTTAVILGALLIHGMRPGPLLFIQHADVVYAVFIGMFFANLMFLGLGLGGAKDILTNSSCAQLCAESDHTGSLCGRHLCPS